MSVLPGEATRILRGFPEPMLVIEPGGTLVFVNDAAAALLEVSPETAGAAITDFLPERERSRLNPLVWLRRWAETPGAPEADYVHLHCRTASGRELPVRVRVGRHQEGGDAYYVVMLQDISREQHRQQQSRAAHRLAARVLAISADAIVTVSPDLTISYANPSAERLFGYASGELNGRPLNELLPARFQAAHPAQIAAFAEESRPARLMGERAEIVGLTRSGEELPLEASITKVTLDRDVFFSAHLRDLRPRKAAERELARTRASLQTIFDHAVQAMALIDPTGQVLEMNAAARRLLPDDVDPTGRYFAGLPFFSTDADATAAGLRTALDRCLAGEPYRITTRIAHPDGREQTLDFSLTPVREGERTFAVVAEAHTLLESEAD
ncbi:MAG: PAS domain S-box protein [Pseudomonadales bacterium]